MIIYFLRKSILLIKLYQHWLMNYGTIKPRIVELVAQYNLLGIAANKEKKCGYT